MSLPRQLAVVVPADQWMAVVEQVEMGLPEGSAECGVLVRPCPAWLKDRWH